MAIDILSVGVVTAFFTNVHMAWAELVCTVLIFVTNLRYAGSVNPDITPCRIHVPTPLLDKISMIGTFIVFVFCLHALQCVLIYKRVG